MIQYYAVVENGKGEIEEVLVTRIDGKSSQASTGVIYDSARLAIKGLESKNAHLSLR
jgi:uncharacterized protein YpbB